MDRGWDRGIGKNTFLAFECLVPSNALVSRCSFRDYVCAYRGTRGYCLNSFRLGILDGFYCLLEIFKIVAIRSVSYHTEQVHGSVS